MLEILYYPEGNRGPVRDYLSELAKERPKAFARLFFVVWKGAGWLLHSIEKKSAKTPKGDLELARKRLREVMVR